MHTSLSKLGFGLSGIAGSGNFSHQEKLIRTAIDCGVTHFDTAPYYGSGDAEKILGDVLATFPDKVTITTKFGLVPLSGGAMGSLARSVLRPLFRKMRSVKTLAAKLARNVHKPGRVQEHIQKSALPESLEASVRKLRRPVDVFLLHEATLEMVRDAAVLEGLVELRKSGKISLAGVSGPAVTVLAAVQEFPEIYQVAQLENSLPRPAPLPELGRTGATVITYRAIQSGLSELLGRLERQADFKRRWLRETGLDPATPERLAQMLLELAMWENPEGTVLFSTTRPERIKTLTQGLESPILTQEAARQVRRIFETGVSHPLC